MLQPNKQIADNHLLARVGNTPNKLSSELYLLSLTSLTVKVLQIFSVASILYFLKDFSSYSLSISIARFWASIQKFCFWRSFYWVFFSFYTSFSRSLVITFILISRSRAIFSISSWILPLRQLSSWTLRFSSCSQLVCCLRVSLSSFFQVILSSDAWRVSVIFSLLLSSISSALSLVSCLNSAWRSLNSFSELILTSVISTVSSQIPQPLNWSLSSFCMFERRWSRFLMTSSMVELAIRFLKTLSQRAFTLSLASQPCRYLQHLKGPSSSRKTDQKANPQIIIPCISTVMLLAEKYTLSTLLGNVTIVSRGPRHTLRPTPACTSFPSRMTSSHSLGWASTHLLFRQISRQTTAMTRARSPQTSAGGPVMRLQTPTKAVFAALTTVWKTWLTTDGPYESAVLISQCIFIIQIQSNCLQEYKKQNNILSLIKNLPQPRSTPALEDEHAWEHFPLIHPCRCININRVGYRQALLI